MTTYKSFKRIIMLLLSAVLVTSFTSVLFSDVSNQKNKSTQIANAASIDLATGDAVSLTAATANKTYTLTVVPEFEFAGTEIDWAIKFNNAASTWATGKTVTDYATITPQSDGALKATLTVKQAFGEQIIVTANVRGNAAASAYCTVDYERRFTYGEIYKFPNVDSCYMIPGYDDLPGPYTVNNGPKNIDYTINLDDRFFMEFMRSIYTTDFLDSFDNSISFDISPLKEVIRARYYDSNNSFNDSVVYEELNPWAEYNAGLITEASTNSKKYVPMFFNYIQRAGHNIHGAYVAGFYTSNNSDKAYSDLMLCRFLGLYPDNDCTDPTGAHYYLNLSSKVYSNILQSGGITTQLINLFKYKMNARIDQLINEGVIVPNNAVFWQHMGVDAPDEQVFDYIFTPDGHAPFLFGDCPVFFGINKFVL